MLAIFDETFPPSLDTAVSHALMRMVAAGKHGESLRLYRPSDVVAFGKRDVIAGGFGKAVASAYQRGFHSTVRLAGGRAAVFHRDTIAFAWTIPTASPSDGITERFERLSALIVDALRDLGADARIGEVPGEYCPGEFSVNLGGLTKIMGVGQRLIAGAAHVGGVIVVDRGDRVADVLIPVYRDLDLAWDPATAGDLTTAIPDLTWQTARDAVLHSFEQIADITHAELPPEALERARTLEPGHKVTH